MSRAQIRVEANERITIEGKPYRVTEHPALPGIPYIQRGARGFVIQLAAPDNERMALKYFKLKYRVPDLVKVASALRKYAELPGMKAARRTVFTQETHASLIAQYPALEYGMLMPWLPGMTWYDLITSKAPISRNESIRLAQSAVGVLATLEDQGLAHTDIAGANVMVDRRSSDVQLVDIEEVYGPDQPPPVEAPAGQDGYQHKQARAKGQWSAEGDRFSAAMLLAEMLGWSDGRLRQNSADEHFFASAEMQDPDSARFRLMSQALREQYSDEIATLFEQAWRSQTLAEAPALGTWREALAPLQSTATVDASVAAPSSGAGAVISGRRAIGGVSNTAPTPMQTPLPQLTLDGVKLCRNCGAENPASYTFCKRCGFFVGTVAQRTQLTAQRAKQSAVTQTTTQAPASTTAPTAPIVKRDNDAIIVAKRVGDPGKGMQRITTQPAEKPEEVQPVEGSWVIAGVIIFMLFAALVLVLLAR
jgi:tRNA A-37 threonylcarbamoyl transferase component Bud32